MSRKDVALPLVLAGLLVLATFGEALGGDALFAYRDAARMELPFRAFTSAELHEGRFPLWFPYESTGVPFFAQLVPGVLHPLNFVCAFLPLVPGLAWNHVGASLLALLGAAWWLRGRGVGGVASASAGLVYALGGPLVSQSNLQYLVPAATLPWCLGAFDRFLDGPSPGRAVVAAMSLAVLVLGGDPQAAYFAGLFVLADLVARGGGIGGAGRAGLAALGAFGFAAIQLFPAMDVFASSARAAEAGAADGFVFEASRIVELLWPGRAAGAVGDAWSPSVFLGPVTLLLAVAGVRERRSIGLAVVAVVLFWASFGEAAGLEWVLRRVVPLWESFRYPEKLVAPFSLAVAGLSAFGIERISARIASPVAGWAMSALVALPVAWAAQGVPLLVPASTLLHDSAAARLVRAHHTGLAPPRIWSVSDGAMRLGSSESPVIRIQEYLRETLSTEYGALDGIETFDWYLPARDPVHRAAASIGGVARYGRIFPVFSIDALVVDSPEFGPPPPWKLVDTDAETGLRLFKPGVSLPRVFVASSVVRAPSGADVLDRLIAPEFRPGSVVLAETDVTPDDAAVRDRGTATLEAWWPGGARVTATMQSGGVLVLNEGFARGWRATIDGADSDVFRVNGLARGVRVPAGSHVVEFRYAPLAFTLGAWVSLLTSLGAAAWVLIARRARPAAVSA